MSRARDDARRNNRREFALYRTLTDDDYERSEVGSYTLGQADGCWTEYRENGQMLSGCHSEAHEPGSHFDLPPQSAGGSAWGPALN